MTVARVLHLLTRASLTSWTGHSPADEVLGLARALTAQGVTSEIVIGVARRSGTEAFTVSRCREVDVVEFPWDGPVGFARCLAAPGELSSGLSAGLRALLSRVAGCDLVHAHDLPFAPLLAAAARSLTGTPFLTSSHGLDVTEGTGSPAYQRLLCTNDYGAALVAPHSDIRDRMAALASGTPVLVVPPGIDSTCLPAWPPGGRAADEIVFIGPPRDSACLPALLAALAVTRPGMRLRIAGGETLPVSVVRDLQHLGFVDRVLRGFRGLDWQPGQPGAAGALRRAALLVAAGGAVGQAQEWVLTAAASGVPVIAAPGDGVADVLGPGYPGLLPGPVGQTPVRQITALAEKLLGQSGPHEAIAEVRARVVDQYLWSAVATRYRDIYRAVSQGRPPLVEHGPHDPVPMAPPDITEREVQAARTALLSGRLTAGQEVERFEQEFADWHGGGHAVTVNSAASALFAVLSCAGVRGEVLVPSFTWAATANAVVAAGAVPVWVDIDEDTLGMSAQAVAAAIGPRTEAVLCVHYAGHPCRVAELAELCERHGLLLVEDAAEAVGARQDGRLVGTFGTGCYSFYPTKNMTTGEGGMVLTDDDAIAAAVRTLRSHGMRPVPGSPYPWQKEAVVAGFNFRMPEPLAAVGRRQLERLTGMNDRRRAVAARLDAALAQFGEQVRPHRELPGFRHVYQMYVVRLGDPAIRDELVARLRAAGVEASVHFDPPVHRQRFYRERYRTAAAGLPATDDAARRVVTLPMHPDLSDNAVQRVVASLSEALDMVNPR